MFKEEKKMKIRKFKMYTEKPLFLGCNEKGNRKLFISKQPLLSFVNKYNLDINN